MLLDRSRLRASIREIAEAALRAEDAEVAWCRVMATLERAVGFESGFIAITPGPERSSRGAMLGHEDGALRSCIGSYLRQITLEELRGYHERARIDSDVWSRRRRRQMAQQYAPLAPEVTPHMLVRVGWRRGAMLGINLERGRNSCAFGQRELALVDAVAPLIQVVDLIATRVPAAEPDFVGLWHLTAREAQVAGLVVRGLQNAEVADVLAISANRVRNMLVRIFEKAHASTRTELVFLAQEARVHPAGRPPTNPCSKDGVLAFAQMVRGLSESGAPEASQLMAKPTPRRIVYSAPHNG